MGQSQGAGALLLVTTEKDMARIGGDARLANHAASIATLPVKLIFDDTTGLRALLAQRLVAARDSQRAI